MRTADFDYYLPSQSIAQAPAETRDSSRLMVLDRSNGSTQHRRFRELGNYLEAGDCLVFNNSRVIPARMSGEKSGSGTAMEILLLRKLDSHIWESLARPAKKATVGTRINIAKAGNADGGIEAEVLEQREGGIRVIHVSDETLLEHVGGVPLPPYIHAPLTDTERYQTVYAAPKGSVAAPTAGLHFTPGFLNHLQEKGIRLAFVTLHIGLDTFRPVRVEDPRHHPIHKEYGEIAPETTELLNQTRKQGKRIVAVGTSTVRVLETAVQGDTLQPFADWVDLFILPGHRFCSTDGLITNFHLPRSTLLMLVSAFAGREAILHAYEQARHSGYRFYSFGDAMLIL